MAEELDNTIRENATGPESASADGVQVKQQDLRDQIEADKYLAGKDARRNPAKAFARGRNGVRNFFCRGGSGDILLFPAVSRAAARMHESGAVQVANRG
jgi:hypothetical protein